MQLAQIYDNSVTEFSFWLCSLNCFKHNEKYFSFLWQYAYRCRAGFCVACGLVSSYFLILFGFVWVLLYCLTLFVSFNSTLTFSTPLCQLVPFCLLSCGKQSLRFWFHCVLFDSAVLCKLTRCKLHICRDWFGSVMYSVQYTAEIDLVVWCTQRRLNWRCDANRGDSLRRVMHTAEVLIHFMFLGIDLQLLCDAHHGDWLAVAVWCTPRGLPYSCCEMHTTEIELDVGCTAQRLTWMCDVQHRDWLYKINGMHTAEFLEKFEYFNAIKKLFKNILACLAGAQMGSNHEWSIRLEKIKILKKYPNG